MLCFVSKFIWKCDTAVCFLLVFAKKIVVSRGNVFACWIQIWHWRRSSAGQQTPAPTPASGRGGSSASTPRAAAHTVDFWPSPGGIVTFTPSSVVGCFVQLGCRFIFRGKLRFFWARFQGMFITPSLLFHDAFFTDSLWQFLSLDSTAQAALGDSANEPNNMNISIMCGTLLRLLCDWKAGDTTGKVLPPSLKYIAEIPPKSPEE